MGTCLSIQSRGKGRRSLLSAGEVRAGMRSLVGTCFGEECVDDYNDDGEEEEREEKEDDNDNDTDDDGDDEGGDLF